jgi:hypothetical protein
MRERPVRPAGGDWRRQVVAGLFGLTSGIGVNLVSADMGYPEFAAAASASALVAAVMWVRGLPAGAPLVRLSSWTLLAVAAFAAVAASSGFLSRPAVGVATLVAAACAAGGALVRSGHDEGVYLFAAAAPFGGGVAVLGMTASAFADGPVLLAAAGCAAGVASVWYGVAVIRRISCGPAVFLGGLALAGAGVAGGLDDRRFAWAVVAGGVALAGLGVAILVDNRRARAGTLMAFGAAALIGGGSAMVSWTVPAGVALCAVGASFVVLGFAVLTANGTLRISAVLGLAIASIGYGIAALGTINGVQAAPVLAAGGSLLWYGLSRPQTSTTLVRVRRALAALLKEPSAEPGQPLPSTATSISQPE